MARPLNVSELDWYKSEVKRLQEIADQGAAESDKEIQELRDRVQQLEEENRRLRTYGEC